MDGQNNDVSQHQRLRVTEHRDDAGCRLEVVGEIDITTGSLLSGPLMAAARNPASGPIVVDLSQVAFIDSAGLAVLVMANREMRKRADKLRVIAPPGCPAERTLQQSSLVSVFDIVDSPDGASEGNGASADADTGR